MKTDKLCIDDYVINIRNGSYIKIDSITNHKVGYHRNGDKSMSRLVYARREEIEPIELNTSFSIHSACLRLQITVMLFISPKMSLFL